MSSERNKRILLIDDNPAIHRDFRKILAGESGGDTEVDALLEEFLGAEAPAAAPSHETLDLDYELDSAMQGEEALAMVERAIANRRPYAMAFVDVRMPPGWNGIETLSRIWQADPKMQAVICTAFSDYSYADMLAQLGSTDRLLILKKPFDPIEVQQLAGALIEKWNVTRSNEQAMEEVKAYAASLETVNLALTADKAMAEAFANSKSEFICRAAKEIEKPAQKIREWIETAAGMVGAEAELKSLAPDADSLVELVRQVAELSELAADTQSTTGASCEFREVVDDVVALAQRHAATCATTFEYEALGDLPESIEIAPERLAQLLIHVTRGGIDLAAGGRAKLSLQLEETGGFGEPWVRCVMALPGVQLNPDQRRDLFEPFQSASRQLSLPIARQASRLLGADLYAESNGDEDSALVLRIDPGSIDTAGRRAA